MLPLNLPLLSRSAFPSCPSLLRIRSILPKTLDIHVLRCTFHLPLFSKWSNATFRLSSMSSAFPLRPSLHLYPLKFVVRLALTLYSYSYLNCRFQLRFQHVSFLEILNLGHFISFFSGTIDEIILVSYISTACLLFENDLTWFLLLTTKTNVILEQKMGQDSKLDLVFFIIIIMILV